MSSFGITSKGLLRHHPPPALAGSLGLVISVVLVGAACAGIWQAASTDQVPFQLREPLTAAWSVRSGQTMVYDGPPVVAVVLSPLAQGPGSSCMPAGLATLVWCCLNGWLLISSYRRFHWRRQSSEKLQPLLHPWHILVAATCGFALFQGAFDLVVLYVFLRMNESIDEGHAFPAGLWFAAMLILQPVGILLLLAMQPCKTMQLGTFVGLFLGFIVVPGLALGLDQTSQLNRHYLELVQQRLCSWMMLGATMLAVFSVVFTHEVRLVRFRVMTLCLGTLSGVWGQVAMSLVVWLITWWRTAPGAANQETELQSADEVEHYSRAA